MLTQRHDPFATYQFEVDLNLGDAIGHFGEVSGLELSVKFDEVREGGANSYVHKLPTRIEYGNLTLRRGVTTSKTFLRWCMNMGSRDTAERRPVTIKLVRRSKATVAGAPPDVILQWVFQKAFPVKWSGPSLKAGDNSVAIESLELAHDGLTV
jgi:phage tail-like protein